MSYNRLRRLAGLNESFTDNERVNAEIEDQVAKQEPGSQHRWMDLLEIIYDAGKYGIDRDEIDARLVDMYPNMSEFGEHGVDAMLAEIGTQFGNMVAVDGDHFVWKFPTANDMEMDEFDPHIRQAVSAQVDLGSRALEVMRQLTRQRGSFSQMEVAQAVSRASGVPMAITVQHAEHMITQFRSMLRPEGADRYALIEEPPTKNADTMEFLKGLAKNAKPSDLPDE